MHETDNFVGQVVAKNEDVYRTPSNARFVNAFVTCERLTLKSVWPPGTYLSHFQSHQVFRFEGEG